MCCELKTTLDAKGSSYLGSVRFSEARSVKKLQTDLSFLVRSSEGGRQFGSGNSLQWCVQNKSFCSKRGWCRPPKMPRMRGRLWCCADTITGELSTHIPARIAALGMEAAETRETQSRRKVATACLYTNIKEKTISVFLWNPPFSDPSLKEAISC